MALTCKELENVKAPVYFTLDEKKYNNNQKLLKYYINRFNLCNYRKANPLLSEKAKHFQKVMNGEKEKFDQFEQIELQTRINILKSKFNKSKSVKKTKKLVKKTKKLVKKTKKSVKKQRNQ